MKPKKADLVVDADHYPSLSLLLVTLQRLHVKHPPLLCRSLNPVHIFLHVYPRANVPLFIHVEVSHIWRLAHALWHHFLAPDFNETPPCKRCFALVFVGQNPHSVLPSPNQQPEYIYIYIGWLHTHILLELYHPFNGLTFVSFRFTSSSNPPTEATKPESAGSPV